MVGIGAVKGLGMMTTPDDSEIDRKLGRALASIDHATLALHLGRNADSQMERIERARQAQVGFESALQQLEKADPALKAREEWRIWYDEAHHGLAAAKDRRGRWGSEKFV